jgi:hypothetical protein
MTGTLVLFTPLLFPESLTRESLFGTPLFTRFHVVAMLFDLFNNVLRLDLPFKSSKCIFQRLALLDDNFCHAYSPPFPVGCLVALMGTLQCSWSTPEPAISNFYRPIELKSRH